MAGDTPVNSQITDSVTQANVKVLGDAPAESMGTVYQVFAQTVGVSMQNAVGNQQNANTIDTAITTQGVNLLYSLPTATDSRATTEVFSGNSVAETMQALKAAVQAFS
ncbi:RebB family R body protein [Oceanibacterium hippocampi]|uniref:Killing trait n=1 Tax=Oceanibacterium hippocampi TaxID=745714 RepID=A0A1Y5TD85_9PROT|nr:RebB family R body protein [Oceanibacterium hippocampi]SLN57771.1 Killing trait [Oceanibacterium hippocampi]